MNWLTFRTARNDQGLLSDIDTMSDYDYLRQKYTLNRLEASANGIYAI